MTFMERENMRERAKAALRAVMAHAEEGTITALAEWLLHEGALFPPVKMGQTVYAVLFEGDDAKIYPWEVQGVAYMQDKWYAVEFDGSEWEVGRECCHLTREAAEKYKKQRMEEIKGEKEVD